MKLEVTEQEVGVIQKALLEMPAKYSLPIILKIDEQRKGQDEAPVPAPEETA